MKEKKAFTLIELLVVVAIIALLLAILIPSLNKARQLAYRIVCGSRIKNIATASYTYASTFGDYFVPAGMVGPSQPPQTWPISNNDYLAGGRYWYENETFRKYLDIESHKVMPTTTNVSAIRVALAASPKEYLCPADKVSKYRTENEPRISYAYNNSDWRPWTHEYRVVAYKVETVTRPAETLNFIDSITHDVDFNGANYLGVWDVVRGLSPNPATWPVITTYGSAHYRHSEGANVGFYDGHAQWLKKQDIFDIDGYCANPARTGMWTASGRMIPDWFVRFQSTCP